MKVWRLAMVLCAISILLLLPARMFAQGTGLIAYWNLDEGYGNIAHDNSGNDNDGTIYGASWTTGMQGSALLFDGVNDFVDCGATLTGTRLSQVTVHAWAYIHSFSLSHIFYDGSDGEFSLTILPPDSGIFQVDLIPQAWQNVWYQTEIENLTTNTWYHLVGTYDGATDTIKIYLNGQLANQSAVLDTPLHHPWHVFDPTIGAYSFWNGAHGYFFNGIIDEVRIYDRVLNDAEIQELYNPIPFEVWSQRDERWRDSTLNSFDHMKIGRWGCALTSMAMLLSYYDCPDVPLKGGEVPLDPLTLNRYCDERKGFGADGSINWDVPATLVWKMCKPIWENPKEGITMDAMIALLQCELDAGRPVILQVKINCIINNQPTQCNHFVLAFERVDDTYRIADPYPLSGDDQITTLDAAYGNKFTSMRVFHDKDEEDFVCFFVESPINIYVTDPEGRHAGIDPLTDSLVFEIPYAGYETTYPYAPNSSYNPDIPGSETQDKVLFIPMPVSGTYNIEVVPATGADSTETFSIRIFFNDECFVLARDVALADIPDEPYRVLAGDPSVIANIDIDPDVLNLKSMGLWITCYIELPDGYDVNDIDVASVFLNRCIPAELHPNAVGDYDEDSIPDLMVKFDRSRVQNILEPGDTVEILVVGNVLEEMFGGMDTIVVIYPDLDPMTTEPVSGSMGNTGTIPLTFFMSQNSPNPLSTRTSMRFGLPHDVHLRMKVYDSAGRLVNTLIDGKMSAGYHKAWWDGTDELARKVSTGVYFYQLMTDEFTDVKKMILLR